MVLNLKLMLYLYEAMSGLNINFEKSVVLMIQHDDNKSMEYANLLKCLLDLGL